MKKLLLILFFAMGILVSSARAPFPFNVKAPSWTKISVPSLRAKKNVTVYKQPSVNSAKLYYMPDEGDMGNDYQWRTTPKRG